MAVRTPFEGYVAVCIRVVRALDQGDCLSALCGLDYKFCPVSEVSDIFAVRRHLRLEAGLSFIGEKLFLEIIGISEILVLFFRE